MAAEEKRQKRGLMALAPWRRAANRGEKFVEGYEFPSHIRRRVQRRHPQLNDLGLVLVERGLREWLICCAWRGRTQLGMPSRAVDDAWHEFILDSVAYTQFCKAAFGDYLHHNPDETMSTPMSHALSNTVRAWDRSRAGKQGESVLWDLDEKLQISDPLGMGEQELGSARAVAGAGSGWAGGWFIPVDLGDGGGGGGDGGGGGGDGGGGCGGGCGGGGCGGGG
jgi:hypothetical protein